MFSDDPTGCGAEAIQDPNPAPDAVTEEGVDGGVTGGAGGVPGTVEGGGGRGGSVLDRRLGLDRRDVEAAAEAGGKAGAGAGVGVGVGKKADTGLERRRGVGRRRSDFMRDAEEGEMSPEQFLFLMAIEGFKKANAKLFPTWTDVLEVVRLLGYRKTMRSELNLRNAEDWLEKADSPSKVRAQNPSQVREREAA